MHRMMHQTNSVENHAARSYAYQRTEYLIPAVRHGLYDCGPDASFASQVHFAHAGWAVYA